MARQIEPIGSERSSRGQLPTLPLNVHRALRLEDEEALLRPALSRRSSYDFSVSSSSGPSTGIFPPVEFTHSATASATSKPSDDFAFPQLRSDEKQIHSPWGHTTPCSLDYDASPYHASSPSPLDQSGFIDPDARRTTPTSTTLEFSTGRSIWS